MLADPISIAANAPTPALVFKVIRSDGYGSERRDAAGVFSLIITHEKTRSAERHYVKLSQTISAVNPLTGTTSLQTAYASLSLSIPLFGWTAAQAVDLGEALFDTINDAEFTLTNLVGWQS